MQFKCNMLVVSMFCLLFNDNCYCKDTYNILIL